MCDSCIVQLNVAYNLKKNAVQSDIKLRQYIIEYGMNVTSYTTCINTVSIVRQPSILMPATQNYATAPAPTNNQNKNISEPRPFSVMPVVIKEEPIDYEAMSDITIDTNTETCEDSTLQFVQNQCRSSIIARRKEKSVTPLLPNSMVAVGDRSLLISAPNSDGEYLSAYLPTPSSTASDHSPSGSSTYAPPQTSFEAAASNKKITFIDNPTTTSKEPQKAKASNEKVKMNTRKVSPGKTGKSLRLLHELNINMNIEHLQSYAASPRVSRTKDGTMPKKNYNPSNQNKINSNDTKTKSFKTFLGQKQTPPTIGKLRSVANQKKTSGRRSERFNTNNSKIAYINRSSL